MMQVSITGSYADILLKTNKFTQAYIECALWSSSDDEGNYFDNHSASLSSETLEKMQQDCVKFQQENTELLEEWYEEFEQTGAGHDFWLTRNHHGAGFWDRTDGPLGQKLTDAAHAFGEFDLYLGDDGQIWGA